MTKTYDYDLFVIGAGSGGVRAARVSAAHGARVAIAEEYKVGGTCVIRGCVPKKLLVYGAHFAEDLQDARRFGWKVGSCKFDWAVLRDNVLAEVERLEGIYTDILDRNEVEIFTQRATVTGPNRGDARRRHQAQRRDHPDRHRRPAGRPRRAGRRAWHHLERDVPPRRHPEARGDRRRRLYRQRIRRHPPRSSPAR